MLFQILCYVVAGILDLAVKTPIFAVIVLLGLLLPSLAVLVRRLHDTGRSGGWFWIGFVPLVGSVILFVFTVLASEPGPNRYNESDAAGLPFRQPI